MDRILDSGSNDKGSIPFGSTKKGYYFQKLVTLFSGQAESTVHGFWEKCIAHDNFAHSAQCAHTQAYT